MDFFKDRARALQLSKNHNFGIDLNDDLTGLVGHYFMVQGFYE